MLKKDKNKIKIFFLNDSKVLHNNIIKLLYLLFI